MPDCVLIARMAVEYARDALGYEIPADWVPVDQMNPVIPEQPPAMDKTTFSVRVAQYLDYCQAYRQAYDREALAIMRAAGVRL